MSLSAKVPIEIVFDAIDGEREYQEWRWCDQADGHRHTPGEFIVFMETYYRQALTRAAKESGWDGALDEVRKVAALGVACMEQNGVPPCGWPRCDPPTEASQWRKAADRKDVYAVVSKEVEDVVGRGSWPTDIGSQLLVSGRILFRGMDRAMDMTIRAPFDDTPLLCVAKAMTGACVMIMANNAVVRRSDAWRVSEKRVP